MTILDYFLHSPESRPSIITKALGCFFLMLGVTGGAFFLFQALIPVVGYGESGAIICGTLVIIGMCFLMIGGRKKLSLQEEVAQKALTFFKGFDVEKTLKNNALPLSVLSLGLGLVLSQFKNERPLSEFVKKLK